MAYLERLLDDAIAIVDGVGAAWAVMGGCARNAYAEPRATKDVDLVVEADRDRFLRLEASLRRAGFKRASAVGETDDPVPDLALYRDDAGRRIDILFAHTDFERSALDRRTTLAALGSTVAHVITAEDLIVYKLIADRPQDRADISAVVEAQRARQVPIDWTYVERWCEAWDLSKRLAALRAELDA